MAEVSNN